MLLVRVLPYRRPVPSSPPEFFEPLCGKAGNSSTFVLPARKTPTFTLAVTAVAPLVAWGARWPETSTSSSAPDYYMMDIPGLVQSYGTGANQASSSSPTTASTSYSRSLAITSYAPPTQYASSPTQLAPQQQLHNPFGYHSYSSGPNRMVSALHNPYSQPRPQTQQYSPQTPITNGSMSSAHQSYLRNPHQLAHSQSRYDNLQSPTGYMVKPESQAPYMSTGTSLSWNHNPGQTSPYSPNHLSMYQPVSGQSQSQISPTSASGSTKENSPKFGTDVDTLMQAIQSKPQAKEAEAKAQSANSSSSRGNEDRRSTVCSFILSP